MLRFLLAVVMATVSGAFPAFAHQFSSPSSLRLPSDPPEVQGIIELLEQQYPPSQFCRRTKDNFLILNVSGVGWAKIPVWDSRVCTTPGFDDASYVVILKRMPSSGWSIACREQMSDLPDAEYFRTRCAGMPPEAYRTIFGVHLPTDGDPSALKTATEIEAYCQKKGDSEARGEDSLYPGIENTTWRCQQQHVLVCYLGASGRACLKMDTSKTPDERIRTFCRERPNADVVPMAAIGNSASMWKCMRTQPVVTETAALDGQNYSIEAWRKISVADSPDKQVRAFVDDLYSRPGRSFLLAGATDVFSASLVKLIAENRRLLKGELGVLDFNPLCQCQDPAGLKATVQSVKLTGVDYALADVDLELPGGSPRNRIQLSLEREQDHWRIRDIMSQKMPSLREALLNENKGRTPQTPQANSPPNTINGPPKIPAGAKSVVQGYCNPGSPFDGHSTTFVITVPSIADLQSADVITLLLNDGMKGAIEYCQHDPNTIRDRHPDPMSRFSAHINAGNFSDVVSATKELRSGWQVNNRVAQVIQKQQQEAQEKAQREATERARQQAANDIKRSFNDQAEKRREEFIAKLGIPVTHILLEDLEANPFAYKGKVVVYQAEFRRMNTATEGAFFLVGCAHSGACQWHDFGRRLQVVIRNIPEGLMRRPGPVIVAGEIAEKGPYGSFTPTPSEMGAPAEVPVLLFKDIIGCAQEYCKDFFGQ